MNTRVDERSATAQVRPKPVVSKALWPLLTFALIFGCTALARQSRADHADHADHARWLNCMGAPAVLSAGVRR